jgi:hypothetical protein
MGAIIASEQVQDFLGYGLNQEPRTHLFIFKTNKKEVYIHGEYYTEWSEG